MTRATLVSGTVLLLAALGLAVGVLASRPADAQVVYQCPPGYAYDPTYGCLPLSYFYGPPAYPYPGVGFGFFYGGHWDRWHDGGPRGGAPHGGGGAPHGGGGGGHRR